MELLGTWALPLLVVAALAILTLGFAALIGRWIDAQSNSVVDDPRRRLRKKRGSGPSR